MRPKDTVPTFHELLNATAAHGRQRFRLSLNGEPRHLCLHCDATFDQTKEGWRALKAHEVDEHDQAGLFDWHDLHGKQLTIAVVETREGKICDGDDDRRYDVYWRDDDGYVYHLATGNPWGGQKGWKWKPSRESNLNRLTLPAPVPPSNG